MNSPGVCTAYKHLTIKLAVKILNQLENQKYYLADGYPILGEYVGMKEQLFMVRKTGAFGMGGILRHHGTHAMGIRRRNNIPVFWSAPMMVVQGAQATILYVQRKCTAEAAKVEVWHMYTVYFPALVGHKVENRAIQGGKIPISVLSLHQGPCCVRPI